MPVASPLVALPVPEVLPVPEEDSPLTPCTACARSIAKKAAACPNCGAPNEWVHPEIVRFYKSIAKFDFERSIQITHEKFVLVGIDQQAAKDANALADLANSFSVMAPLNLNGIGTMLAVRGGQQWVTDWAKKKVKAFRIDFTNLPAVWSSTDDEYWLDVMKFFGVRRAKRRR